MSDKERLSALLKDFGLTPLSPDQDGRAIRLAAQEGGVMGHPYFFVDFCFAPDGKFLDVGVWE